MGTVPAKGTKWLMDIPHRVPMDLSLAHVPQGQVFIIPNRCKGCKFCIEFCPKEVLAYSDDINSKGYHYPVVAPGKEKECVHCRFCDLICPELAIYSREVSEVAAQEEQSSVSAV